MDNTEKVQLLPIEYSDKPVSPWGGLRLLQELIIKIKLPAFLSTLSLPSPGSNRGYNPVEVIKSFMVSIWIGGNRYSHCGWLRYDDVLKQIFGWKQTPSESTFSRFFRKFNLRTNNEIFPAAQEWFFKRFDLPKFTLDLDSTVVERYGKQEGSQKGYNPRKKGRPSQHPIIAFISELKLVVNGWLRPGNTTSANNMKAFLEESFRIIDKTKIGLLRADNGFCPGECLSYFELEKISYIVSAKFNSRIKKLLVRDVKWIPISRGIWVGEFSYKADDWEKPRRCIVVRKDQEIYPEATGRQLKLFPDEGSYTTYRYSLFFTNLELPPEQIWNLYKARSDAENRIKELKEDFAVRGFSSQKFYATEAAFRFALLSYNIMALFRLVALKDKKARRMATLYFKCIAIGSWVVKKQRRKVLKLSVPVKKRGWIDGLFQNLLDFDPSIRISNA